jgi:hypothetical protein
MFGGNVLSLMIMNGLPEYLTEHVLAPIVGVPVVLEEK